MRGCRTAAAALAVTLVGACGSTGGDSVDPLTATASNLGAIHSGTLSLRLSARAGADEVGFSVDGPFAVEGSPSVQLRYTRIGGAAAPAVVVTVLGGHAWVQNGGRLVQLPDAQAQAVASRSGPGFGDLHLARWFRRATTSAGGSRDGVSVDRIGGDIDASAVFDDVLSLLAHASGQGASLTPQDLVHARPLVRGASVELLSGHDDHLLRHLDLSLNLAAAAGDRLAGLGDRSATSLHVLLDVGHPNAAVSIATPSAAGSTSSSSS